MSDTLRFRIDRLSIRDLSGASANGDLDFRVPDPRWPQTLFACGRSGRIRLSLAVPDDFGTVPMRLDEELT